MKITAAIKAFLQRINSPHAHHFHPDIELQINPVDADQVTQSQIACSVYKIRVPENGDTTPIDNDREMPYPTELIQRIGVSGWNWRLLVVEYVVFDFDAQDGHVKGLSVDELRLVQDSASRLPYVSVYRSRSGRGLHFYVALANPVPARNRDEHALVGLAILRKMSTDVEFDLVARCDAKAVIGWIWDSNAAINGFELVKAADCELDDVPDWKPDPTEMPAFDSVDLDGEHNQLIAWLVSQGYTAEPVKSKRCFKVHTAGLKEAHTALKLKGAFETIATGKDRGDHNCYIYPAQNGAWRVYRYSRGCQEAETWQGSKNGWTCCVFNADPPKESKPDDVARLVALGLEDDLFHSNDGRSYATLEYNGRRETYGIQEESYRHVLRLRFHKKFIKVAKTQHLQNAVDQLAAIAQLERPEHSVHVRVAGHAGNIYIDLCDAARRVIEVSAAGWRIIDSAPIRFRRSAAMLPLSVPNPGTIDLLRRFVNVRDEDWPLALAWIVSAFRPIGPYPLLVMIGEPGCAKSTLARVFQLLIDPNGADVRAEPTNIEDLVIAAHHAWLVAFDNLSDLKQLMSDAFCRLSTGGGFGKRKLFSDDAEKVFKSMRPVLLTSVKDVVTAPDLLDRCLLLELPVVKSRMEEVDFWREFEQARPAIFGALLDALSSAIRSLPTTKLGNLPRMADFAKWSAAAEAGLGLEKDSIAKAYARNRSTVSGQALDTDLGRALVEVAKKGFKGTAKELTAALGDGGWSKKPRALAGEVRMLAPNLRQTGVGIDFRPSNGKDLIELYYTTQPNHVCYDGGSQDTQEIRDWMSDQVAAFGPFLRDAGFSVEVGKHIRLHPRKRSA